METSQNMWQRFKGWKRDTHRQYVDICSNRNSVINVLLAIALSITIVISLFVLAIAICFLKIDPYRIGGAFGIAWIYYSLFCIYYMSSFLGGQNKSAILPAYLGSTLVWYFILFSWLILISDHVFFYDKDEIASIWSDLALLILPLIGSLLLNVIFFGLIFAIMRIKKNGISVWSQLKNSDRERTKNEKISIKIFFILLIIPVIACGILMCKSHGIL